MNSLSKVFFLSLLVLTCSHAQTQEQTPQQTQELAKKKPLVVFMALTGSDLSSRFQNLKLLDQKINKRMKDYQAANPGVVTQSKEVYYTMTTTKQCRSEITPLLQIPDFQKHLSSGVGQGILKDREAWLESRISRAQSAPFHIRFEIEKLINCQADVKAALSIFKLIFI